MEEEGLVLDRLYCMDCLDGIKLIPVPDLIVADPPYDFEALGGVHKIGSGGEVKFDRLIDAGLNSFDFDRFIPSLVDLMGDRVNAYFFCNKRLLPRYLSLAVDRGLLFDVLVLRKLNPIPAFKSAFVPELEYVVHLRSSGVTWNSDCPFSYYRKCFNVKLSGRNNFHPTQKPVEFLRRLICVSSNEGDLVLDPFVGSGSTALAASSVGRCFVGFDVNEDFLVVARDRLKQSSLVVDNWFE